MKLWNFLTRLRRIPTRLLMFVDRISPVPIPRPVGGYEGLLLSLLAQQVLRFNDLLGGVGGFAGLVVRRFGATELNPLAIEDVGITNSSPQFPKARNLAEGGAVRIALAVGSLAAGGAERQISIAAPALAQQPNIQVSLLTMNPLKGPHAFYLADIQGSGVQVQSLRAPTSRFRQLVPKSLRGTPLGFDIAAFLQRFDELSPTVVHAWLDDPNIAAGFAACYAGVPRVVLSGRNVNPTHFGFFKAYMHTAYRWLLEQPNVVMINNSNAGAQDYADWLGIDAARIPVVHNGFDWALIDSKSDVEVRSSKDPESKIVVVGVMRLAPEKRPLHWLQVASQVIQNNDRVSFLLVGEGPLRAECEEFVENHGLSSRIKLLGERKDVYQIVEQSDLFMLTSIVEGLPNVLVEAQFLGVPVATTPAGGASETFIDGVSGITLDMMSIETAAHQVLTVLEDLQWLRGASSAAQSWARTSFSAEAMVANTIRVYNSFPDPHSFNREIGPNGS